MGIITRFIKAIGKFRKKEIIQKQPIPEKEVGTFESIPMGQPGKVNETRFYRITPVKKIE